MPKVCSQSCRFRPTERLYLHEANNTRKLLHALMLSRSLAFTIIIFIIIVVIVICFMLLLPIVVYSRCCCCADLRILIELSANFLIYFTRSPLDRK